MIVARAHERTTGDGRAIAGPVRSVLVIQMKYVGDVVLTSALTEGLRRAFPGVRIGMVCERGLADFATDNGLADEVIPYDRLGRRRSSFRGLSECASIVARARRARYDMSVDVSGAVTSQVLQLLIGARVRIGYDHPRKRLPLVGSLARTHSAIRFGTGEHYVDHYLAPLQAAGWDVAGLAPRLVPSEQRRREAHDLLAAEGVPPGGFIAVHAGARTEPRRWPPERFARAVSDAAAASGLQVALVGGPDERELSAAVAAQCTVAAHNLAGRCALAALPALLAKARLFVGNESGPMHVAAAVGIPVVGLFGLTDPVLWGPVSDRAVALRPAMPCACIRPGHCVPTDTNRAWCVHRLGEAEVADAVRSLLAD